MSTTLSMKGPLFTTEELVKCSVFNVKMVLFVITIIICVSCLSSCLNNLFISDEINSRYKSRYLQSRCGIEDFSNNEFYSYKNINPGYFTYQNAELTSNTDNIIFGQSKKYIHQNIKTSKPNYTIEIFANLYVLNGNPFSVEGISLDKNFKHRYVAYLKNTKTGKKINIGQVLRDGDGLYKLKFTTDKLEEYIDYNEIEITHQSSEKETLVLSGKFN